MTQPPRREERQIIDFVESFHAFIRECEACQKETAPHWQFCAHCGSRLATECPSCGSPLPPAGAHYCPHCGVAIPEEPPGGHQPQT